MSQTLSLSNFEAPNIGESAQLGADAAIAATTITVGYTDNINPDDFIYLGHLGSEAGEVVSVDTISDATHLTLVSPGTLKVHTSTTPVTVLFGDKIKVYRAANVDGSQPADTDFDFLEQISIDYDQLSTTYVDETGGSDYWYKYIYANTANGQESSLVDSMAVRGGGVGNYCSLADIREDAGVEQASGLPDATISRYRRRAQAEVDSKLGGIYVTPFDPIPEAIEQITILLATGWLLIKEYGVFDGDSNKEGRAKLKEGRDWIGLIIDGTATLPGALGVITDHDPTIAGWPNDTTALSDPLTGAGGEVSFLVGEKF